MKTSMVLISLLLVVSVCSSGTAWAQMVGADPDYPVPPDPTLEEWQPAPETEIQAVSQSMLQEQTVAGENWLIRIGFEDLLEDETHVTNQYSPHGVVFQDFGDGNGTVSFLTAPMAPFGGSNWQYFPPRGLTQVGIPWTNSPP